MSELAVIEKSIALMRKTFAETSNRKKYPQKYLTLTREMQTISMDIYKMLMSANRKNVLAEKQERMQLQTKVIENCDVLSTFVELSLGLNLIGITSVEKWQEIISSIKYMTIAWRNKDSKR